MLKVGLIGCGSIAKNAHFPAYKRLADEGAEVVLEAFCDIHPEQMEGLEGRLYTSFDELLEKEQGKLDYIDICVPTHLHAEFAIKAMEAGFHVLCEKPMARTVEQGQQMIDAAKRTGKTLMSAYCNRFYTGARYIRDLIQSGELGAVRSAQFYRQSGPHPVGMDDWFFDYEKAGGATLDLHIHDVDMIRWMFGMPEAVSVAALSTEGCGYDLISANFMYENNVFVHAHCDWVTNKQKFNTRAIHVNFEKGYVHVDRTKNRQAFLKVTSDGEETDLMEILPFEAYYGEIFYFIDRLTKKEPVSECMPESTLDSVRIVMAEIESADKNGERIAL